MARVMEFLTAARRAVPTVIGYRQMVASAPMTVHTERAMSSAQTAVVVVKVTTLPRSSVITAGVAGTPARCAVVIWSSGNARPMRSASTTGRLARAAHEKGTTPFSPPSSRQQMAATCVPVAFSTASCRRSASVPAPNFSTMTVVAPIMQNGQDQAILVQLVQIEQLHRARAGDGLRRHVMAQPGIAPAARSEDRRAEGEPLQLLGPNL